MKETYIGKVRSVSGSTVSILLEGLNSTMPIIDGIVYRIGQIGSYVKIPLGYNHLFGIVTKAGADAIPENLKETIQTIENLNEFGNRWLTVALVGERIGERFERGVAQYPTADDEVHLVTIEDLEVVYGGLNKETAITVGQISASESLPAQIDVERMLTRHCAILGSTGSGKSNAVSVLLESIANNQSLRSARILVIDPHGEYNDSLKKHCKVFKVNADSALNQFELRIPFWALPFEEIMSIFSGRLNDTQRDYVRNYIYQKKTSASKLLIPQPPETSITSDSPIPFSLNQLWFELDDIERRTFNKVKKDTNVVELEICKPIEQGDAEALKSNKYPAPTPSGPFINQHATGILSFLSGVRTKLSDERFKFLFSLGDYQPDLDGKVIRDLHSLLGEWLDHTQPITILDLSGVPSEIMASISGAVLKIVYDCLYWGQYSEVGGRQQPLLITLEEAHNYLKAGEESIASRTVQAIAKEGRKYGVGLLLVTQRPSELDETVLSQCGSVIALRMNNSKDRAHISGSVQDDLIDLVNILPTLRTGEGIILGEIVKIPSRVKFDRISHAPKSTDPKVIEQWKRERPNPDNFKGIVELWRQGKFK